MFAHRHLLGIEPLSRVDIEAILDLAERYVALNRAADKRAEALRGLTQINMFFEASTRTQASFELAGEVREGELYRAVPGGPCAPPAAP